MSNIRQMIAAFLRKISLIMVLILLISTILLQILTEQSKAKESSEAVLYQVEHMLEENNTELAEIIEEYSATCLNNAEGIAYIIQRNPEVLDNMEELMKIAAFAEVDEIHIFDNTGKIVAGTHPEYYGFTMESGEQIGFFKPMLEDKSLRLCQSITPNTAEGKMMQYSALWSENGDFILQVGMEPVNIMKLTEKNELSYIFSLLKTDSGENIYAVDKESGEIIGSTITETMGKNVSQIGISMEKLNGKNKEFHAKVNGNDSYCIFRESDDYLIGRVVSNSTLYKDIPVKLIELTCILAVVAIIFVHAVSWYINKFVISPIYEINKKLGSISEGNLDEKVDCTTSYEFSQLSSHINDMVNSILASTDKISYILNRTDMRIGVYEYNTYMKNVRFTDYVPAVFGLMYSDAEKLKADYVLFRDYIDNIRKNPVAGEKDVYCFTIEQNEHYVRLEEISHGTDILGIVIDVTDEFSRRRQIEAERDIDLLTGLFNRRGLEQRLDALFREPEKLGFGALIMIDADGLKEINDKYGHDKGDLYLKKISEVISSFGKASCVCSRQGGDEFVVFLYNYESENELLDCIDTLKYIQNNSTAYISEDTSVQLRFSFGYSLIDGSGNYAELLKQADERMYASKASRKKALAAAGKV